MWRMIHMSKMIPMKRMTLMLKRHTLMTITRTGMFRRHIPLAIAKMNGGELCGIHGSRGG